MRIAEVCPYSLAIPGGVQSHVVELARELRARGHDVVVVAPDADGIDDAVSVGGAVGVRANGAVAPVALDPRAFGRVRKAIAAVDVVHVHEPAVPFVGWGGLTSARTVATFHADPSRLVRALYRIASGMLRRIDVATAVSAVAESAIAHRFDVIHRVPNGLDVASYRAAVDRDPTQVAFLGRPDPRKGRDLLLEAWPRVKDAVPTASLKIMGDGGGPDLEDVAYLGRVDEDVKRSTLAGSAVFCAPNRGGESFGITVAEGMAAGCAIVASDIPAFVDLLDGTGDHFANGDAKALADALIRLLEDRTRLTQKAAASSARVEAFDWTAVADSYEQLFATDSV